jgi:hypothetical protein
MKNEKVVDRSGMVPQTRADSRRKYLIPRLSALIRAYPRTFLKIKTAHRIRNMKRLSIYFHAEGRMPVRRTRGLILVPNSHPCSLLFRKFSSSLRQTIPPPANAIRERSNLLQPFTTKKPRGDGVAIFQNGNLVGWSVSSIPHSESPLLLIAVICRGKKKIYCSFLISTLLQWPRNNQPLTPCCCVITTIFLK